jgi:ribonuclease T1
VINNPKAARIIAVVVIAMLVITLAASLFGCSAAKPSSTDPESGLTLTTSHSADSWLTGGATDD